MLHPADHETPTAMGILSGTVADPSGARINEAAVHVESGGMQRDTTTDSTGSFSLPLPPGSYAVTVTASGFRDYTTNITLSERAPRASLSIRLQIAATPEEITVPAAGYGQYRCRGEQERAGVERGPAQRIL